MPNFQDNIRRRENAAIKAHTSLLQTIRGLQREAYQSVLEWLLEANLEQENGRLKYTVSNMGKVQGVFKVFERFGKTLKKVLFGEIQKQTAIISQANERYFTGLTEGHSGVQDEAREAALLRLGYNPSEKYILPGSYFEKLFSTREVAERVASLVNQAIQAQMPLSEFRKTFRPIFVGFAGNEKVKGKVGLLEARYRTFTQDLYQRIDRQINLTYADRLGLNYAIYAGTIIETSRDFCEERNNKVFKRSEIRDWHDLEFDGKPTVYVPEVDLGGFNCRHHLNWVTDEIAKVLRPDLGK